VREELAEKLRHIVDEKGGEIGTVVYHPEFVYEEIVNIPPDLIVHLGSLDWRSAGSVGTGTIHMFENDTGPDDANHALEGIFIMSMELREPVAHKSPYSIFDIAPTVLDYFGIDVPRDMIGESLLTDGQWLLRQPRELAEGLREITVERGKRAYEHVVHRHVGFGEEHARGGGPGHPARARDERRDPGRRRHPDEPVEGARVLAGGPGHQHPTGGVRL
jgi:hypothetical protein